jgi:predicted nucleic acid-binding protein
VPMQTYGVDTSILVRLLTGEPEPDYGQTVEALEALLEREPDARVCASNMVLAEAYIVVQYHYGVTKAEARSALLDVLQSGLVEARGGRRVLRVIEAAEKGAGLVDRLIVDDYQESGAVTLTLDERMARLDGARSLG